jgi:hypothetical protein
VLAVLFWVAAAGAIMSVASRMFGLLQDRSILSVPATVSPDVRLPASIEVAGPLPVTIDLDHPNAEQRLLATLPAIAWWALVLTALVDPPEHRGVRGSWRCVPRRERPAAAPARDRLPARIPGGGPHRASLGPSAVRDRRPAGRGRAR